VTIRISAVWIALLLLAMPAAASNHYTEKQLDALETRVGKVFWITPVDGKLPIFLSAPAPNASTSHPAPNESFEIIELVGRQNKNPYYRVKFESGREAYIHAQAFHEQFNATIVTIDPLGDEKKARADEDEEEKVRVAWINSQPWSAAVKDAAIKRQPITGMTLAEAKMVLGKPRRVSRIKGPHNFTEEHWFYPDGSVLIFHNGALNRVDTTKKRQS
jgi:hypothetical protein